MVAVSSDINKMENFFHGALVRLVASRCEYLNGHRDNNTRHCTEPTRGGLAGGIIDCLGRLEKYLSIR